MKIDNFTLIQDLYDLYNCIFYQGSYGGYVYTYAVKSSLHMTSAQGAFLTSVFWVSNYNTKLTLKEGYLFWFYEAKVFKDRVKH